MLVILSFSRDPHAAAVQLCLADRSIPSITIFVDRLWTTASLQSSWKSSFAGPTVSAECNACLQEPFALWLRRPNYFIHTLPHSQKGQFARQEWRVTLDWLIAQLSASAAATLNPWNVLQLAKNKPAQLEAASRLGLDIPETLISNSRSEIQAFVAGRPAICKSISPYSVGYGTEQRVFYTRSLTCEDVQGLDETLGVPLIVQERVQKLYEIRAAFIGEHVFAVKIPAEYEETSSVDWREHELSDLNVEPIDLPDIIIDVCRKMMSQFSLICASFDFIVSKDERYFFLEFNEQGNFLFIDHVYSKNAVLGAFCDLVAASLQLNGREKESCGPDAMIERVSRLFESESQSNSESFFRRMPCAA